MKPIARRDDIVARPLEGGLVILSPDHAVHHLDAVAAWVWAHADGSRDVDALLAGLRSEVDQSATRSLVFDALDRLGDASLLQSRVGPPAGMTRRGLLRRLTGGAALAALTAVVGLPESALAAPGVCGDDKDLIKEIAWLEAEAEAVAAVLDDWVEASIEGSYKYPDDLWSDAKSGATGGGSGADTDTKSKEAEDSWVDQSAEHSSPEDDVTEEYIALLRKDEELHKERAAKYRLRRSEATQDLKECKLAKKGIKHEERVKRREKFYAQRKQKLHIRLRDRERRQLQRKSAYIGQESAKKAQVHQKHKAKEEQWKKQLADKPEKLAAKTQHLERVKKRMAANHIRRLGHHEQRTKATENHYKTREKSLASRQETRMKAIDQRLVDAKERQDLLAEAFASKKKEKAEKALGVKDRAYQIAQESAIKAQEKAQQIAHERRVKKLQHQEQKEKKAQAPSQPQAPSTPKSPSQPSEEELAAKKKQEQVVKAHALQKEKGQKKL